MAEGDKGETLTQQLAELLSAGRTAEAAQLLAVSHPVDAAATLEDLPEEMRQTAFALLSDERAGEVLDEADDEVASELVSALTTERASDIVEEMPSDEAADLLADLPEERAEELLSAMEADDAARARELLQYDETSAGGQMASEFVAVPEDLTVGEVTERLRELIPKAEFAYYVYVVDAEGHLRGVTSLRELLTAEPQQPVSEMMRRDLIWVSPEVDQEEAARVVARYDLLAVPVLAADGRMVGMITVDDVAEVMEEEAEEDVHQMWGAEVGGGKSLREAPLKALLSRTPSLAAGLAAGLVGAALVRMYDEVLAPQLIVALLVPLLLLVTGATSSQATSSVARATLPLVADPAEPWRSVSREMKVAVVLSAIAGACALAAAAIWGGPLAVAWAIGIATALATAAASMVGWLAPLVWARLGGQGTAAAWFARATADVAALVVYFAAAAYLLTRGVGAVQG
ncbi:MAG: magnesium transporter [Armatimonadota bacterium]|nr:MAG: magnesium transporter [Armatimonadota bacterium]